MGLAFGLSRDEELEKTRLDLERARMEREDFRQGSGPDTSFLQYDPSLYPGDSYARGYKYSVRPRVEYQMTMRKILKRAWTNCDTLEEDLRVCVDALKRIKAQGSIAADALREVGVDDSDSE
jgi:hypothetical protein